LIPWAISNPGATPSPEVSKGPAAAAGGERAAEDPLEGRDIAGQAVHAQQKGPALGAGPDLLG
jgi:hypothetical protein